MVLLMRPMPNKASQMVRPLGNAVRVTSNIAASVIVPSKTLTATSVKGGICATATRPNKKEPPQITDRLSIMTHVTAEMPVADGVLE
jgi:hypothetical protein